MEAQTQPVCRRGCGLPLSAEDAGARGHRCVDALRALSDALEERSATLEHDLRMSRLRWNRREQSLLTKVSSLQNEARLAALRHQRRLHQYVLRVGGLAEQVVGYCQGDARTAESARSRIADGATRAEGDAQERVGAEANLHPTPASERPEVKHQHQTSSGRASFSPTVRGGISGVLSRVPAFDVFRLRARGCWRRRLLWRMNERDEQQRRPATEDS
ncbi:uncharacterized protein LOC129604257, partial [Betta splendens]|uniref:Uncharacterized protein LOC129604257 n=1 Tax=Betta splendens TaxID=158456 RepID=A0A9W2XVK2_BETSP